MMLTIVFLAVLIGCFHGNEAEITIIEDSLTIENLGGLRIHTRYTDQCTFSLTLKNSRSDADSVYYISAYLANDPVMTLKSQKFSVSGVGLPFEVAPTTVNGPGTSVTGLTTNLIASSDKCYFYTYLCVVLSQYNDEPRQCIDIRDYIVCSEIKATALWITNPSPSSIKYTTTAYTDITFKIVFESYESAAVADVKLYFTNGNDMNHVNTTYEGDEILVRGMTSTGLITSNKVQALRPLEASPKVDVQNCAHYTHLCGVIVPTRGSTVNSDVCIPLGPFDGQAGTIICPKDGGVSSGFSIHGNMLTLVGASILAMLTTLEGFKLRKTGTY